MTDRHSRRPERSLAVAAVGALCALASLTAGAQSSGPSAPTAPTTPSTPSASSSPLGNQLDASPYYLGASESLTHDSNVFRTPSGPSDNYSSTSLLGGFDQPIGRQRVFGTASVSLNRYQREHELNNTSYNLATGANLETIEHLSGSLNAGLGRSLSAPTANVEVPTATRNQVTTRTLDGSARWGGTSILTLEATAGWSSIDYSAPESAASESRQQRASLGLIYGPGGPLRVGVSGNFNRTKTPNAFIDPVTGAIESNTTDGKSLDLTADYQISGIVNASGRVGYTRQSSSGSSGSDFSGLTGGVSLGYNFSGKTSFHFDASRDAGFNNGLGSSFQIITTSTGPTVAPVASVYQNNRVTNSFGAGANYSATAKIKAVVGAHYSRATLVNSTVEGAGGSTPETTDVSKSASLGASYAITRYWDASCRLTREWRDVSGGSVFSYTANTASCSTQLTLR